MKSKFLIKIKKLILGKYFSTFQSIFKGSGLEITDTRKYTPGDPYKYINRKNTAKHNELWTSLFQQEREINLDVFLDINYNRRSGIANPNYEKVIEFFVDMLIYCQKNGIRIQIFYPTGGWFKYIKIESVNIQKHRERAYQFIDTIYKLIKHTPHKYQSGLNKFLEIAKANTKRRAIIIFSDFLDISADDKNILQNFTREHSLSLIQIPVDKNEGQNYSSFLLDIHHPLDVESLQTIEI